MFACSNEAGGEGSAQPAGGGVCAEHAGALMSQKVETSSEEGRGTAEQGSDPVRQCASGAWDCILGASLWPEERAARMAWFEPSTPLQSAARPLASSLSLEVSEQVCDGAPAIRTSSSAGDEPGSGAASPSPPRATPSPPRPMSARRSKERHLSPSTGSVAIEDTGAHDSPPGSLSFRESWLRTRVRQEDPAQLTSCTPAHCASQSPAVTPPPPEHGDPLVSDGATVGPRAVLDATAGCHFSGVLRSVALDVERDVEAALVGLGRAFSDLGCGPPASGVSSAWGAGGGGGDAASARRAAAAEPLGSVQSSALQQRLLAEAEAELEEVGSRGDDDWEAALDGEGGTEAGGALPAGHGWRGDGGTEHGGRHGDDAAMQSGQEAAWMQYYTSYYAHYGVWPDVTAGAAQAASDPSGREQGSSAPHTAPMAAPAPSSTAPSPATLAAREGEWEAWRAQYAAWQREFSAYKAEMAAWRSAREEEGKP